MSEATHDELLKRLDAGEPCCDDRCRVMNAASGCTCAEAAAVIRKQRAVVDAVRAAMDRGVTFREEIEHEFQMPIRNSNAIFDALAALDAKP